MRATISKKTLLELIKLFVVTCKASSKVGLRATKTWRSGRVYISEAEVLPCSQAQRIMNLEFAHACHGTKIPPAASLVFLPSRPQAENWLTIKGREYYSTVLLGRVFRRFRILINRSCVARSLCRFGWWNGIRRVLSRSSIVFLFL